MLAELLEADEEGRGRVDAARRNAEQKLQEAHAAHEAARQARALAERQKLDDEMRQIAEEADAQAAERRARREQWLRERETAARARIEEAAAVWIRIVLRGEP